MVGDCVVSVVVVVGDCVVDGAFEPLPLQLAIDATNASQNRHTRQDARQANRIQVFHHDISNRFGFIADPPLRLRESLW